MIGLLLFVDLAVLIALRVLLLGWNQSWPRRGFWGRWFYPWFAALSFLFWFVALLPDDGLLDLADVSGWTVAASFFVFIFIVWPLTTWAIEDVN